MASLASNQHLDSVGQEIGMIDTSKEHLDTNQGNNDALEANRVLMLQIVHQRVDHTLDVLHFFVENLDARL